MKLYLMRHAEALPVGGDIKSDDERPLSARGRRQASTIGKQLREAGFVVDQLLVSPTRRTRETAKGVAESLGQVRITIEPALAPSGSLPPLITLLEKVKEAQGVLLIGHQPDIGLLATSLGAPSPDFSPATLTVFEADLGRRHWKAERTFVPGLL